MRRKRTRWLLFVLPLYITSTGLAFDPDYGPFPPDRRPRPFALQECVVWRFVDGEETNAPTEWVFGVNSDTRRTGAHVRLIQSPLGELTLEVRNGKEKTISGPKVVSDARYWGSFTADLNADGKPDFLINTNYLGCGLAGWNATLVFAISNGDKYEISSIFTMFRDYEYDLVDLDHDGRCRLIHVAVLWSNESDERDGKYHTYWVFHKIEIKNGRWVVSARDRVFPKWVWYTFKPNQKATKRLSEEAKSLIWRAAGGDDRILWQPPAVASARPTTSGRADPVGSP